MTSAQFRNRLATIFHVHNHEMLDADAKMRAAFEEARADALRGGMTPAEIGRISRTEQTKSVTDFAAASLSQRNAFFDDRKKAV